MAFGVALRDDQGWGRNVCGVDGCSGQLLCKGDGDAAGAGADIGDLQALAGEGLFPAGAELANGEAVEGDFDDMLGFWAGNQDVGRDFKLEAPEFLFAGEMLRWFARGAPSDKLKIFFCVRRGDFLFRMRVEPGAVAAEDVEEQKLCGKRERRDVRFAQLGEPLL